MRAGRTELVLASATGMCQGVRWALAMVEEARSARGPGRLLLLRPIIHNPTVGRWLEASGVATLDVERPRWWDDLRPSDTVIIPAFGATVEEERVLRDAAVGIVDTTCPSVRRVWGRVETYAREGFTTLLHGRQDHPETKATLSRVEGAGGHYLVLPDLEAARAIAPFIAGGLGERLFPPEVAMSPGFDPHRDLRRVGMVNQTTMLAEESEEIARVVRDALVRGGGDVEKDFRSFGTICRATQQRQDAIRELIRRRLDVLFVVGGHASSNTRHLAELGARGALTLHVEGPDALEDLSSVWHQEVGSRRVSRADLSWLTARPSRVIGFAGGASTPDAELEATIARVLFLLADPLPPIAVGGRDAPDAG